MTAVETHDLGHRYGDRTALAGVSVSWPGETLVGVLGPNGSGKSTLLGILSTARTADTGSALVLGFDVRTQIPSVRERIGTVFQSPALDPELTVRENLDVFAALHGVPKREARDRIGALLSELDVVDRADDRAAALSGGLLRRADLARSLVHEPDLLLLDEPTGGLDPTARRSFWSSLDRVRSRRPLAVVLTTHAFDEATACDHLVIMDAGRIATEGSPGTLVDAMGPEALWVDCEQPKRLHAALPDGCDMVVVGRRVRIQGPDLTEVLLRIRALPGADPMRVEIRPPNLADVYESATGKRWTDRPSRGREDDRP